MIALSLPAKTGTLSLRRLMRKSSGDAGLRYIERRQIPEFFFFSPLLGAWPAAAVPQHVLAWTEYRNERVGSRRKTNNSSRGCQGSAELCHD